MFDVIVIHMLHNENCTQSLSLDMHWPWSGHDLTSTFFGGPLYRFVNWIILSASRMPLSLAPCTVL